MLLQVIKNSLWDEATWYKKVNNLWLKGEKSALSADSKSTNLPSLGTEKIQYPNAVAEQIIIISVLI